MPGPADVNLDELKKKARRRLVGACVLALAAAVFVPMLLESDERPLGDDISVKIPPVDQGKFVNRLNSAPVPAKGAAKDAQGKAGAAQAPKAGDAPADAKTSTNSDASDTPAVAAKADKASTASKSLGDAERRVLGSTSSSAPSAAAPASAQASASSPVPSATSPSAPAVEVKPASVAPEESKGAASAAETKQTIATSAGDAKKSAAASPDIAKKSATSSNDAKKTVSAASKSARGEFVVQLAAFSDDKGANALANRLKRTGHPAFTEPVTTSRGTLWRVRVGPYASRDEANAVRDKLKREGQDGIVTARS